MTCARAALSLLDGFCLTTSSGPERVGDAGQRLLALLALDSRPCSRDRLAGRLWPDHPRSRALANLRSVLWRLPQDTSSGVVLASGAELSLGRLTVDVRQLQDALTAQADPSRVSEVELTVSDLTRELLPGWDDDWVIVARERLRKLRLNALELLCTRYSRAGSYYQAVEAGTAATQIEPLRESAHRLLMAAHLAAGNGFEAMHQYQVIRQLLWEELGIRPSARTRELVSAVGNPPDTAW